MRRPIVFAAMMAMMMATAACGGKKTNTDPKTPEAALAAAQAATDGIAEDGKLDSAEYEKSGLLQKPPERGQGQFGYNEPLEDMWHNGVGMRVVAQDWKLAVSIHNRTGAPIQIYPHQFRIVMADRSLYAFEEKRNELLGFPERPIPQGGRTLFIVSVPDMADAIGRSIIYQYPPRKVIVKTEIEPVVLPAGPQ